MNNSQRQITGILFYIPHTRSVQQVLEGPIDEVTELYQKISQDPRHTVDYHESSDVVGRDFVDWNMLLVTPSRRRCDRPLQETELSGLQQKEIGTSSRVMDPCSSVGLVNLDIRTSPA